MVSPDTIVAIATPAGRGGVGIVRVSGKDLRGFAQSLGQENPEARKAQLTRFYDAGCRLIDTGLLLYFPAPRSFTGEDVLELHGHGGPLVLRLLLERCLELGARLAEPGEFTRRAYLNGKIDLAQAEAVIDLIDASTAAAARSAARSLQGELSCAVRALLDELVELRARVEATLDFPEEDIDGLSSDEALGRLDAVRQKLSALLRRAACGQRLQHGLRVVIAGQPNVGKSSLLNCLAGDDIAIVTPAAGTTRDPIRASFEIDGVPIHLVDTAGIRETREEVETLGIARAWKEIEQADLILMLVDARTGVDETDAAMIGRFPESVPYLTLYNKIDLTDRADRPDPADERLVFVSATEGAGIDRLRQKLLTMAGGQPTEDTLSARARHVAALNETLSYIDRAKDEWPGIEFFAEALRLAQRALDRITGEFSTDELLGEIFDRFCVGK